MAGNLALIWVEQTALKKANLMVDCLVRNWAESTAPSLGNVKVVRLVEQTVVYLVTSMVCYWGTELDRSMAAWMVATKAYLRVLTVDVRLVKLKACYLAVYLDGRRAALMVLTVVEMSEFLSDERMADG